MSGSIRPRVGNFADAGGLWLERNAFLHAGSLAFYTLFSLAPIVIIAVAFADILSGEEAAKGQIVAHLQGFVGREGALAALGLLLVPDPLLGAAFTKAKALASGKGVVPRPMAVRVKRQVVEDRE